MYLLFGDSSLDDVHGEYVYRNMEYVEDDEANKNRNHL